MTKYIQEDQAEIVNLIDTDIHTAWHKAIKNAGAMLVFTDSVTSGTRSSNAVSTLKLRVSLPHVNVILSISHGARYCLSPED